MSELSLDMFYFEERLMKKCEVILPIQEMTYSRRMRVDDLAPDRSLGIIAAYEYLAARVTHINTTITIPALGIMILALMLAVVAWAVR